MEHRGLRSEIATGTRHSMSQWRLCWSPRRSRHLELANGFKKKRACSHAEIEYHLLGEFNRIGSKDAAGSCLGSKVELIKRSRYVGNGLRTGSRFKLFLIHPHGVPPLAAVKCSCSSRQSFLFNFTNSYHKPAIEQPEVIHSRCSSEPRLETLTTT